MKRQRRKKEEKGRKKERKKKKKNEERKYRSVTQKINWIINKITSTNYFPNYSNSVLQCKTIDCMSMTLNQHTHSHTECGFYQGKVRFMTVRHTWLSECFIDCYNDKLVSHHCQGVELIYGSETPCTNTQHCSSHCPDQWSYFMDYVNTTV